MKKVIVIIVVILVVGFIIIPTDDDPADEQQSSTQTEQQADKPPKNTEEDYILYAKNYVDRYCNERKGWSYTEFEIDRVDKDGDGYIVSVYRDMIDGSKQGFKYKATPVDDVPNGAWEIEELGVFFEE